VYVGRTNRIYASTDAGLRWRLAGILPVTSLARRCMGWIRPCARLLRFEPRALAVTGSGAVLASTREGLFYGDGRDLHLKPTRLPKGDQPAYPPMTITADRQGRFLWGEYFGNPQRRAVRLYVSLDGGKKHEVVREFAAGEIRHIHNVVEDEHEGCFWVLTGDKDRESGILRLSWDLTDLQWVARGKQLYRAVMVFCTREKLIYGTDSELHQNYICHLDKRTGSVETVREIPGSCIYATVAGQFLVLSTTVERSEYIKTNQATLWVSHDGQDWRQVWQAEKDAWPLKYFQYGSIVLPRGQWSNNTLLFSGQALKTIDNRVCRLELASLCAFTA